MGRLRRARLDQDHGFLGRRLDLDQAVVVVQHGRVSHHGCPPVGVYAALEVPVRVVDAGLQLRKLAWWHQRGPARVLRVDAVEGQVAQIGGV